MESKVESPMTQKMECLLSDLKLADGDPIEKKMSRGWSPAMRALAKREYARRVNGGWVITEKGKMAWVEMVTERRKPITSKEANVMVHNIWKGMWSQ